MKKSLLLCLMGLSLILGACKMSGDHDDAQPASDQSISVAIALDMNNTPPADAYFDLTYDSNGFVQTASCYGAANPSNVIRPSIGYATVGDEKVCSVDEDSNGTVDRKWYFVFDLNGRIVSVLQDNNANGSFNNSGDRRIDYAYDVNGRVSTRTFRKTLNADGSGGVVDVTDTYAYTGSNLLPDSITESGSTTAIYTFEYSVDGKTISAKWDEGRNGSIDSSWVYTLSGNTAVVFDLLQFADFLAMGS